MKEYTNEEILKHVRSLLSWRDGYGAFGESESSPPYSDDVKSAEIINQLLEYKKDYYTSLKKEFEE